MNKIYAYSTPLYPDLIKVGQTTGDVEKRISNQFPQHPTGMRKPYTILFVGDAISDSGDIFSDIDIHNELITLGIERVSKDREWFKCEKSDIEKAFKRVRKKYKYNNTAKKLTPIDKLVLIYLLNVSKHNIAFCRQTSIANELEIGLTSTKQAIKDLILNKYILKKQRGEYFILKKPLFYIKK